MMLLRQSVESANSKKKWGLREVPIGRRMDKWTIELKKWQTLSCSTGFEFIDKDPKKILKKLNFLRNLSKVKRIRPTFLLKKYFIAISHDLGNSWRMDKDGPSQWLRKLRFWRQIHVILWSYRKKIDILTSKVQGQIGSWPGQVTLPPKTRVY